MRDLWRSRRWLAACAFLLSVLYVAASIDVRDWLGAAIAAALAFVTGTYVLFGRRRLWRFIRFALRRIRRRRSPRAASTAASPSLLGILTLSSYGFEQFCRDLLEREGYRATVTKATGDQGVDVELASRDGRIGVAQCKQVLNAKIGRPTVQQLYGEMISRRATFGFLITTGTFTTEAREWARPKTITLVDRDELLVMVARQSHGRSG